MGQDQDSRGGNFDVNQIFHGDLAELMFFNVSLAVSELKDYVDCRGLPNDLQPLLQFDDYMADFEVKGSTITYNMTLEEVCTKESLHSLILFPVQMVFEKAAAWCELLNGHLFLPSNTEENDFAFDTYITYENQCLGPWSCVFWLGIRGNLTTGKWHKLTNSEVISWNNFSPTYDTAEPGCQCASMGSLLHPKVWFCGPCYYNTCPLCQFDKSPLLRLRGPCVGTFDKLFTIAVEAGKAPEFLGFFKSRMFFDGDVWRLEPTVSGDKSSAVMISRTKNILPIGRHTWNMSSDKCGMLQVICCNVCYVSYMKYRLDKT